MDKQVTFQPYSFNTKKAQAPSEATKTNGVERRVKRLNEEWHPRKERQEND
jgi:hypothetical protein